MCNKQNKGDSSILGTFRQFREDFWCRICGFNALSDFHLELHLMTDHPGEENPT
ncbi:hypothetical protein GGF44_004621 [Coemansia sp. RSA 1694]|nr:hypothetical protein GGF44_004621 [Coemansia sp. RSA 1694]